MSLAVAAALSLTAAMPPSRFIGVDTASAHGGRLVSFHLSDPTSTTVVASIDGPFFILGVEGQSLTDHSTLLALDQAKALWEIDTTTGQHSLLGDATPLSGHTWGGFARDPVSNKLYASSNRPQPFQSFLYEIDANEPSVLPIAEIVGAGVIIALAIDDSGTLFGLSISSDSLYSIDKLSGVPTLIGPIGFNANFGQGMDFDRASGVLYTFANNLTTGRAELRTIDPETGQSTFVGFIGDETYFTVEGVVDEGLPTVIAIPALGPTGLLVLTIATAALGIRVLQRQRRPTRACRRSRFARR
jgi:hypothetical protein